MREFIKLNPKLIRALYWFSGIFTSLAIIYFAFFYAQIPTKWIVLILILTLLIIPFFLLIVAYSDWGKNRTIRNTILSKTPFSEIKKLGFNKKALIFSHLGYIDYTICGEINGLQIVFYVENGNKNIAIFRIFGKTKYNSFSEIHKKNKELQHLDIQLCYDNIEKRIDLKKNDFDSVTEIENMLREFTHIAKMTIIELIPKDEFNVESNCA